MISKYKHYIFYFILFASSLGLSFTAGRFLTPTKIEIKDKIVTQTQIQYQDRVVVKTELVEKKVYVHDAIIHKHTRSVVTETIKPDGTKTKTVVTNTDLNKNTHIANTDDTNIKIKETKKSKLTENQTITENKSTITTYSNNNWQFHALIGIDLKSLDIKNLIINPTNQLVFGVDVEHKVIGPIYLGAFGLSNKTAGLSLGVTF